MNSTGTDLGIGVARSVRKASLLALAIVAVLGATMTAQAAEVMTHHVRDAVRTGAALQVGSLAPFQMMSIDVVLPVRDRTALDTFVKDVADPASPSFRHYLTPAQFTEKFGPTQGDYDTVVKYLVKNGFTVTGGSRDGMEIQASGPVRAVESAFNVRMLTWQHPTENRVFYGPDREPTTALAIPLWHVSGLDNAANPHPMYESRDDYAKAHGMSPDAVVSHATTGSGPSASFLGSDMRAAYYGNGSLTGAGQTLGLFEYYGTDLADLTTYYKNVHQTNNVPITLLSTDGTSTSCVYSKRHGCDDGEQSLDMTQALGMAPGLAGLVMFVGSTDTAIISSMTTHTPLSTTIGCSWGWTPADATTLDPYFEKMIAQGQTFFVASGDNSTWTVSGNAESWPADDAYIIAVGGTDLVTASAGGAWKSETAWVDSGGGISPNKIAIPSWQKLAGVITSANKGSTSYRNGPDVAANANFTFYTCADQKACQANYYGGTSFAAPMWAAFVALANQQAVAHSESRVGTFNATIYPSNLTSSYSTNFHDITSGTSGSYSATTGFDLVTGWGSPQAALINTLAP
jgi:subtilase family serine protease